MKIREENIILILLTGMNTTFQLKTVQEDLDSSYN